MFYNPVNSSLYISVCCKCNNRVKDLILSWGQLIKGPSSITRYHLRNYLILWDQTTQNVSLAHKFRGDKNLIGEHTNYFEFLVPVCLPWHQTFGSYIWMVRSSIMFLLPINLCAKFKYCMVWNKRLKKRSYMPSIPNM